MTEAISIIATLTKSTSATPRTYAPCPSPTAPHIQRTGTCPTGYLGVRNSCEALYEGIPTAMPKIKATASPSGTFSSGGSCKAFR